MYKKCLIIVTVSLMICRPEPSGADGRNASQAAPLIASRTSGPYERADRLADEGQFEAALQELQRLRQNGLENTELLWRMAYVRVYLGKHASSKNRTNEHYMTALENARGAVAADSQNSRAYAIQAMAAGRASMAASGNRQKVELSRLVKESVDRSIALDPDLDIGYHVRGRWHYEIATLGFLTRGVVEIIYGGFPDASVEQAARDLESAIERHDRVAHRLYLGITYRKLNRKREAARQFERALEMPATHPDDPEFKNEARKQLKAVR